MKLLYLLSLLALLGSCATQTKIVDISGDGKEFAILQPERDYSKNGARALAVQRCKNVFYEDSFVEFVGSGSSNTSEEIIFESVFKCVSGSDNSNSKDTQK